MSRPPEISKTPSPENAGSRKSEAELRAGRRADALRANLRRRKAQARERTDAVAENAGKAGEGKMDEGSGPQS